MAALSKERDNLQSAIKTYKSLFETTEQLIEELKSKKSFCDIWAASWQNQQNGMCAQQRLRSAWASAQSDQSLHCLHDESLDP